MGDLLEMPSDVADQELFDEFDLNQGYGDGYDDLFDDIEFFDLDDPDDDATTGDDAEVESQV